MATWHQTQARKRGAIHFWHETDWTVCIDPPNQMTGLYRTSTRELAEAQPASEQSWCRAVCVHPGASEQKEQTMTGRLAWAAIVLGCAAFWGFLMW